MKTFITPIILIIAAGLIFFMYSKPTYDQVQMTQAQTREYEEALSDAQDLVALREELTNQYNSIPSRNLDRLDKMLPGHVDTVRLLIELDNIAAGRGLSVYDVSFDGTGDSSQSQNGEGETDAYESFQLGFTVSAPYEVFLEFLGDLERNLRLFDVQSVSFAADENEDEESEFTAYRVQLQTYWLNQEAQ